MLRRIALFVSLALLGGTAAADGLRLSLRGIDDEKLKSNVEAYLTPIEKEGAADTFSDRARIDKAVRLGLRALGYYEPIVSIFADEDRKDTLAVQVTPGDPILIAGVNVNLTGAGKDERAFTRRLKKLPKTGTVLNHADYEAYKSGLTAVSLRRGYFDAVFTKNELAVSVPRHEAYWNLDYNTGERFRFGQVTYQGSQIDTRLLDNMMPFKEGDYYTSDELAEFNRRLANMGWFSSVVLAPDFEAAREDPARHLPIEASVAPRKKNSFEVGLGVASDVGPHARFVWQKPWINRRGHSLSSSTSLSSDEPSLDLSYKIPRTANPYEEYWLFQGGVKHEDLNDTKSNSAVLSVSRNWEFSSGWQRSVGLHTSYDKFTQGDVDTSSLLIYPGISFSRTRAKGGMMPWWGDSQRFSLDVSSEWWGSDVDFFILQAQQTWVRTYRWKHRFVVRGNAGWIKTNAFEQVPPDLRFFAGGDRSVRGYDYKSISPTDSSGQLTGASTLLTGSLEYQYNLTGKWWSAVFFDIGEAANGFANADWKKGAGAGIRWNSPVGPVKLDLAVPVGDPNKSGVQFYIGLGSEL